MTNSGFNTGRSLSLRDWKGGPQTVARNKSYHLRGWSSVLDLGADGGAPAHSPGEGWDGKNGR